jgi:hypothetical protein
VALRFLRQTLAVLLITAWVFGDWLPFLPFQPETPNPAIPVARAVGPDFESGSIEVSDSLSWASISLTGTYTTPPIILATPVTSANNASIGGGYYPIPLVRNVGTTGFDFSMCVDGGSTDCTTSAEAETFHWFAFDIDEAATFDWIEVGSTASVATTGADTAETFSTSFTNTPAVWTQAQTYSQGTEIGAVAWVDDITTSGFNYVGCVHTGIANACDTNNPSEKFGYVAIDLANEDFDSSLNFQAGSATISNSAWTGASFSPSISLPRVMVTQNDDNGPEDPQYAWARNVSSTGMQYRFCEADAGNVCHTHTGETVYWFAVNNVTNATVQRHFRWRDDTTDLNTSGGWLAAEDSNAIGDVSKYETVRLRVSPAHIGSSMESAARTYELQWGDKTGRAACDDISTWTGLADATDAFAMVGTANIDPDGETTSSGLLANSEGFTYVSGEGRESADTTGSIGPLDGGEYTELEYSLQATDAAVTGNTYCFRLYDTTAAAPLNLYYEYPEVTIESEVVGSQIIMKWGTQSGVSDDSWTSISFDSTFSDPVFVCTVQYANNIGNESDGDADSVVCRVQNVTGTGAQVRLQEPGAPGSLTDNETIHWLVVEAGDYDTSDIKLEAFTYTSTVTDHDSSWAGQAQSYSQSYTNPVVLGQVMTYNDADYSVFWAHDNSNSGNGASNPPSATTIYTGKHVAEDPDTTRANETIGVIVIEEASGSLGSIAYEAALQTQTIDRIDDSPPSSYTFNSAFTGTPAVAVISLGGISGTNGGHPVLYGTSPLTATQIDLTIPEEEINDTEQSGNTEYVPYMVFEADGVYPLDGSALDQDTYRFYANNDSVQPGSALAAENTAADDVDDGGVIRLRTAVQVGLNTLAAGEDSFTLQYAAASTCSSAGSWTDVGDIDSAAIWRGEDVNTTPSDGDTISSSLLNSQSNVLGTYEEENDSAVLPNATPAGQRVEWDWVLQNNGAPVSTDYCFRMTLADGTPLLYTRYPQLTTASAGTLSVDIVDSGGSSVADPGVTMGAISTSFSAQQSTGTFGTTAERIRVSNTTGNEQWTLSVAASATTDLWTGAAGSYDFNDSSGATDGGDADAVGGQLTLDAATNGVITPESGCSSTGLTLGSSADFAEGTADTITILTAGATADTDCYWDLTNVDITQAVPAEQPAGSYTIDMVVTVTAS